MSTVDTDTGPGRSQTVDRGPDADELMTALPRRARYREVWVGLLVIAAAVTTLIALFTLTDAATFRGRYIVTTVVEDAAGIRNGDPVRMRGVNIGRVHGFAMAGDSVVIRLELEDDFVVPVNSRVTLRSGGILGGMIADIQPGASPDGLRGGERLPGRRVTGFMEAADDLSGEAEVVLSRVDRLLSDGAISAVHAGAEELQTVLGELALLVREQRGELATLSQRLQGTASGLERATSGPELERSVARLDSLMDRMNRTSASLDRATASLETVLGRVERGEGTLGRLSTDDSLYLRLSEAVEGIEFLVRDIRENPKRYFSFSVF